MKDTLIPQSPMKTLECEISKVIKFPLKGTYMPKDYSIQLKRILFQYIIYFN